MGRGPLPVRDHVVSIKCRSNSIDKMPKFWRLLVWKKQTEKTYLDFKVFIKVSVIQYDSYYSNSPTIWNFISKLGTSFIVTKWSLTVRDRRPMKSRIIESRKLTVYSYRQSRLVENEFEIRFQSKNISEWPYILWSLSKTSRAIGWCASIRMNDNKWQMTKCKLNNWLLTLNRWR